tara:strand:+ start:424 stop:894 length:471 start_codon:yes stop_codon:yes gene_type:complete
MLSNTASFLLISSIFLFVGLLTYFLNKSKINDTFMKMYMGIILVLFGTLKLYDLNKFALIFSKYDIIASKVKLYGYLYPFIEILLGAGFLTNTLTRSVLYTTIVLMVISLISVSISLYNKKPLKCGCLGAFFHMPLSYVTISENLLMLLMAVKLLM